MPLQTLTQYDSLKENNIMVTVEKGELRLYQNIAYWVQAGYNRWDSSIIIAFITS